MRQRKRHHSESIRRKGGAPAKMFGVMRCDATLDKTRQGREYTHIHSHALPCSNSLCILYARRMSLAPYLPRHAHTRLLSSVGGSCCRSVYYVILLQTLGRQVGIVSL